MALLFRAISILLHSEKVTDLEHPDDSIVSDPELANTFLPLYRFTIPLPVASDLGLGGGFCRVLQFPPPQQARHDLAAIWQNK